MTSPKGASYIGTVDVLSSLSFRCACLLLFINTACTADEAGVIDATATCDSNRVCTFRVTVSHGDTGWEHYADHWRVVDQNGDELGKRILLHPHVNEQPFTRSLSGIHVPVGIAQVTIEAHDNVHEYGGAKLLVAIP